MRDLPVGMDLVRDAIVQVADAARQCRVVDAADACQLERAAEMAAPIRALMNSWFAADPGFNPLARAMKLDPDIAVIAMEVAVKPFVAAAAADWPIDNGAIESGECPRCESAPDIAYFEFKTGRRRLVCSRCETDWPVARVACPHCGNADGTTYGYAEHDRPDHRIYICENCRRYLKTLDLRATPAPSPMYEYQLSTWSMDRDALAEGYLAG